MTLSKLAFYGGPKIRQSAMPSRRAFSDNEKKSVLEVIQYCFDRNIDPSYDGYFEKKYSQAISEYMGGGHVEVLCSGTSALFVALKALDLPENSEILVSGVTDAGSISPIILSGFKPRLIDTMHQHYNIGLEQFKERINNNTSAIIIVHFGGEPVKDTAVIVQEAKKRGILVVEDCSQSTGSEIEGSKVGTFGDIAAWSTGSRKIQISGGNGGIVYTKNEQFYKNVVAHSDRGKPKLESDYIDRDPAKYLFPGLNLKSDELHCAIGLSSLQRLDKTRSDRLKFLSELESRIVNHSKCCSAYGFSKNSSPFFYPVIVNSSMLSVDKITFAKALIAEGIPLNEHYSFLCSDWSWLKNYLSDNFDTPNARWIRDNSFNIYLNENYGVKEADDILNAILKVEKYFGVNPDSND